MCSALKPPLMADRRSRTTCSLSSNSAMRAASVRVRACLLAAALARSLVLAWTAASMTFFGVPSRLAMVPAGTPRVVSCSTAASRSVSVRASRRSFSCHCLVIRSASLSSSLTTRTGTVGRPTLTAPRVRRWPRLTVRVPSSARMTWTGSMTPNSRSEARNCRSRCAPARTLSPMMRVVGSTSRHSRAAAGGIRTVPSVASSVVVVSARVMVSVMMPLLPGLRQGLPMRPCDPLSLPGFGRSDGMSCAPVDCQPNRITLSGNGFQRYPPCYRRPSWRC